MDECNKRATDKLFCQLLMRSKPDAEDAELHCREGTAAAEPTLPIPKAAAKSFVEVSAAVHTEQAPEDELAKEMTHDLEMNFNKIAPFGKEDTAKELQDHAAKTQDT